ncbi:GNAT family N-acetyltransferase [Aquibacillus sp. 3ASR75-11]|uniref:GNAT family N-acetyltransferase n=1 Tax=Terrihalobacillus insolitus TaxID=2950438 RepID=A0A9X3WUA8_9BACI|nr:GNAT family N-acetyltransferase [Terrihalobacillus insolitus]MDC3413231.1 GNAT family N-acetyltransferase [Terrihalobacillus insolitus]MDC3425715.1 GNAT family N-acetyltransferase [Terrihalobacillus insolitus]
MFRIRKGLLSDYEQVLEVYKDTYMRHLENAPHHFRSTEVPMIQSNFEEVIQSENKELFVVVQGDDIVGFVMIEGRKTSPWKGQVERNIILIDELCVRSAYSAKGIDHHLFHKVKNHAKKIGADEILLDIWDYDQERLHYMQERMEMHSKMRRLSLILDE